MPPTNMTEVQQATCLEIPCATIGEGNILLNCLKKLKDANFNVLHVFSNTAVVETYCRDVGIHYHPRNANIEDVLAKNPIDYLFSISNPRILSEPILRIPRQLCINYHDSPLPAYAGVQSTSWAILNGEVSHGISWHVMEAGIDTGDILQSKTVDIDKDDSAFTLNMKCQDAALTAFALLLRDIQTQSVKRKVQASIGRSYFGLYAIPPNLGILSFEKSTQELYNLSRSLEFGNHENALGTPKLISETNEIFMVTNTILGPVNDAVTKFSIGTIIDVVDDSLLVRCKDGSLWISLSNIDGSRLSEFSFKRHGLSRMKKLRTNLKIDTSSLGEYRKKETFWRRRLEKYDPTIFFRQRMNVVAGLIDISDSIHLETTIIPLPNLDRGDADFLMATFAAFLGRTCCKSEISFGIVADRDDLTTETREMYSGICPVNLDLQMQQPVKNVVETCKNELRKYKSSKSYLVDIFFRFPELRERKQTPHHNVVVGTTQISTYNESYCKVLLRDCNILLLFSENNTQMTVHYNKRPGQNFSHVTDVLKHFPLFIQSVHKEENTLLSRIPLVSQKEMDKLYRQFDKSDNPSVSLYDEIKRKALRFHSHTAIRTTQHEISYASLIRCIEKIADVLDDVVKSDRKSVIGLHLPNSIAYVVSLLAVLRSRHVFLPLPLDSPHERTVFTIKDANVRFVITTKLKVQCFKNGSDVSFTDVDTIAGVDVVIVQLPYETTKGQECKEQDESTSLSDIAYIMYTSGSTGKPKGVSVTEHGIYNLAEAQTKLWDLNQHDVIGQFASIGFDATISEIFTSLYSGATLAIFSSKERLGNEFLFATKTLNINTITLPPSVLNIYGPSDMPTLRKVITAGEACTLSTALKWTADTNIRFFNAYGPTETTVCATCFEFTILPDNDDVNQELPIGHAIPGAYVCLLDDFLQPVPPDVIGEIYVGGLGLSHGYIGHAKHFNSSKFIQNPLTTKRSFIYKTGDHAYQNKDGTITYVGRLDDMIKIRGQRVDLSEIENIMIQHPKIETAVVVVHKCAKSTEMSISAYVAPTFVYISELKEYMAKVLPRYMLPTYICKFEMKDFPMTLNGKIDRKKLECDESVHNITQTSSDSKSHLNEIQLSIAKLWCQVLKLDAKMAYTFHRQTSFNELGGNSLQLVLLQRAFDEHLRMDLSFTDIGTADTIEEYAEIVRRKRDVGRKHEDASTVDNDVALRQMILKDSILHDAHIPHHARRGSVQFQHFISSLHKSEMKYPKNVLISGVTGFLGAYLLSEILEKTNAHVCCMVRESTEVRGLGRVRENMRRYDLWKYEYQQRIAIVISDLSQPKLGIAPDIYNELTQMVDAVFMNAAMMNFNTGYEDHRIANVGSTKEFINFAMTGVQKRIFSTSTLGVFLFPKPEDPTEMIYYEDDVLEDPMQIAGGYGCSKWASEKLIMKALDYLPGGAIFRPARISGCSKNGYGPKNDLFASTIIGMKKMGCYPDMDFPYDLTPVDYVAKAMVEISVKICNDINIHERVYHLFNHNTLPFNDLFKGMGLTGYPLAGWRQRLLQAHEDNIELLPLTPFFMSSFWDRSPSWPIFDTSNTDRLTSDETKRCMKSSKELLEIYKKYFDV